LGESWLFSNKLLTPGDGKINASYLKMH